MLDLINGLPVHILVVHAVVVFIPLMTVVTLAFTLRPLWRAGLPWAILGNAGVVGAAFVAKNSGENLKARLSAQLGHEVAARHSELGDQLPLFAIGLLVASVIAYLLVRPRSSGTGRGALIAAIVLVLVAGGAASVWTYRVGDSGSSAVWKDTIANTKAP